MGKISQAICIQIDINRPFINTILIGRFEQAVTYEGIQRLCFSCGRVSHKVEACPYTIRKEKEPVALTEDVQGAQVNNVGAGQGRSHIVAWGGRGPCKIFFFPISL